MAILLTQDVISRSVKKYSARKTITESQSSPGREAHIYNLYEDLSMPLSDIIEIGRLALEAKVENIQEKMDGQYFGFTVRNGILRIFTKMNLETDKQLRNLLSKIQNTDSPAGMDLKGIQEKFSKESMSGVRDAFTVAYNALYPVALEYQESLFKNGEVVIAGQIMHSKSQNTIAYDEDSLRFVSPISLNPDSSISKSDKEYKDFINSATIAGKNAFKMDEVPTAKLIAGLESDDEFIKKEEEVLALLISEYGLDSSSTVGDFVISSISRILKSNYKYIPESYVNDVATRFATGKGKVGLALKRILSKEDYRKYRELDSRKRLIVDEAIIPIEEIIQRIGISVIDKLELALNATNKEDLVGFVEQVKLQFEEGFDFGLGEDDSGTLEKIRIALERLQSNKDLFSIASEGIVFTFKGKTYKLTGLFTPINKLRGFFAYGKAKLRDDNEKKNPIDLYEYSTIESLGILSEGGNAFKGGLATIQGRVPRGTVKIILKKFKESIADPLGIEFEPFGSTATDTETVGDIDVAVNIASANEVFNQLKTIVEPENLQRRGSLSFVRMQIPNQKEYVQIDVAASANLSDTSWLMKGGGKNNVKGVFRNLLFSYIAKNKSNDETSTLRSVKYSISFPGGLMKKIDNLPQRFETEGRDLGEKLADPDDFLKILDINVSKEEVSTFEDLVRYMKVYQDLKTI